MLDADTPFRARQREKLAALKAKQDDAGQDEAPAASKKTKKKAKKKTG